MGRERSPDREKAEEIYLNANGLIKLIDIANELNLPVGTIRGWKTKDNWDNKLNGTLPKNTERSEKIRNAPKDKKKPKNVKKKDEEIKQDLELTPQQELFCLYYINNFNATLAYIKAYNCKYETANVEGCRHLVKPSIKQYINHLKKIKKESIMLTEDDILERYMKIAFADMKDFVEWGRIEVSEINPFDGTQETSTREINDVRFKESNVVDGGLVCQVKLGKDGASIKLEDRQKALDWLANYFEMNPMNRHKKEYDNKKLQLEQKKIDNEDIGNTELIVKVDYGD